MGIVICKKCGKRNKSHYKFCLSCGAMLTKDNIIIVEENQDMGREQPAPGPMAPGFAPPMAPPAAPESAPPMAPPPMAPPAAPESAPPMAPPPPEEGLSQVSMLNQDIDPYGQTVMGEDIATIESSGNIPPVEEQRESMEFIMCPNCGAQVPTSFKFCGVCGHPMESQEEASMSQTIQEPQPAIPVAQLVLHDPQNGPTKLLDLYNKQEIVLGREVSDFMSEDYYASPKHAKLTIENNDIFIEDLQSLNGVFVKIPSSSEPIPLQDGMRIRVGGELLKLKLYPKPSGTEDGTIPAGSPKKAWGRLEIITGVGEPGKAYALIKDRYIVGREEGDVIFPEDGYVSGKHMEITKIDDEVFILDLQSSNGTYLSINKKTKLKYGDVFLMGWRLYTIEPA